MKAVIIVLLVLLLAGTVAVGYTGFVPGVSDVMGTNKPVNLGATYSQEDLVSFVDKLPTEFTTDPIKAQQTGLDISFDKFKTVDSTFSQAEVNARINNIKYPDWFASDVQVKIGDDGNVQASGNIDTTKFFNVIGMFGLGQQNVDMAKEYAAKFGLMNKKIPVYLALNAKVENNKANIKVNSAKVGKISLPLEKFDANSAASGMLNAVFAKFPDFYVEKATFDNGKLEFKGKAATQVYLPN